MRGNTSEQALVDVRERVRAAAGAGVGARATACTRASSSAHDDAYRRAETDASVGARTGGATVHVVQPFMWCNRSRALFGKPRLRTLSTQRVYEHYNSYNNQGK